MPAHDRYALAISLLDGDREARKILADLLEEEGERGLAQWAREGRNQKQRRLDAVVMLLPCRAAVALALDGVDDNFMVEDNRKDASEMMEPIERWCWNKLSNADFIAARDQIVPRVLKALGVSYSS